MQFTNDTEIQGTSLQDYVFATYDELVGAFGEPNYGPNIQTGSSTCEWCLKFEDETVATIYDWKQRRTPYDRYEWHVGGRSRKALDHVIEVLNLYRNQH